MEASREQLLFVISGAIRCAFPVKFVGIIKSWTFLWAGHVAHMEVIGISV
jgi:hypothetical protein